MNLAHPFAPAAAFDGGDLDCGNGLLLKLREHIDPLEPGHLLELRSTENSVDEDLPAWCRMTGNELVSVAREGSVRSFLICKGPFRGAPAPPKARQAAALPQALRPVQIPARLPAPIPVPPLAPWSVMGVGSYPRPRWLLSALHQRLENRLSEAEFEASADDAVRLCVDAQVRAGVDVLSDGEQRRDSYASFVGSKLDNCQLIPITDLLPYVEDPAAFAEELRALDVPAEKVRHPAVFGPLGRSRPLALHEARFLRSLSTLPVKVALPGPYLLTRSMWMECISDRAYANREALAVDVVRILREEIHELLAAGVTLVQLDEPVLSEVVFGTPARQRSFMCGSLSARKQPAPELAFAEELLAAVCAGLPAERLALHVCRGNWTPDERAALAGDYTPLLGILSRVPVGTLLLELCTPRAGELSILRSLPADKRLALGMVNPKNPAVETVDEILIRARAAQNLLGAARLHLTSDCGFATFADNPVSSAQIAQAKLAAMAGAAARLRHT